MPLLIRQQSTTWPFVCMHLSYAPMSHDGSAVASAAEPTARAAINAVDPKVHRARVANVARFVDDIAVPLVVE